MKLAAGFIAYVVCAMTFLTIWWKTHPVVEIYGMTKVSGWSDTTFTPASELYVKAVTYSPFTSFLLSMLAWWLVAAIIMSRASLLFFADVVSYIPFKYVGLPTWKFTNGYREYREGQHAAIYEYVDKKTATEIAHLTDGHGKPTLSFPRSTRE